MRVGGLIQAPGRPGELRHRRGGRGRPLGAFGPRAIVAAPYGSDFNAPGARDSYGQENANVRGYGGPKGASLLVVTSGGPANFLASDDGISWERIPRPAALPFWGCAHSPELGLYAACVKTAGADRIYTSPDLVTWTPRAVPDTSRELTGIAWVPTSQVFTACSFDGSDFSDDDRFFFSMDGATWLDAGSNDGFRANALFQNGLGGVLAAGTAGGTSGAAHSAGGTGYVEQGIQSSSGLDCVWDSARGRWVLLNSLMNIWTSVSGLGGWTQRSSGQVTNGNCIGYCPVSDVLVVGGVLIFASTDGGVTFSTVPDPFNNAITRIRWVPSVGLMVALSTANTIVATSPDGLVWTARLSGNEDCRDVTII